MKIKFNTFNDVKIFCNEVSKINSDVLMKSEKYTVDAKSIMGIFSLDLSKELKLEILDSNEDTNEFIREITKLGILVD